MLFSHHPPLSLSAGTDAVASMDISDPVGMFKLDCAFLLGFCVLI